MNTSKGIAGALLCVVSAKNIPVPCSTGGNTGNCHDPSPGPIYKRVLVDGHDLHVRLRVVVGGVGMNHDQLVAVAAKWLQRLCPVVITELATDCQEEPDAIGFKRGETSLVECKANRADFLKDKKKWFRREPQYGMGTYRYYMCLPDVIKQEELPERWGLLYLRKTRVYTVVSPSAFPERNTAAETQLLISVVCRLGSVAIEGVNIRPYVFGENDKNRATIGVSA